MGWFDRLFKRPPRNASFAPTFGGELPIYTTFGTNIYASDVVQQALKCIVDEMKKLKPSHVRYKGNDPMAVRGNIQDILNNPNHFMTTSEFLEKTVWLLLMSYNAFIIPAYDMETDEKTGAPRRRYRALYLIKPSQVEFIEDEKDRLFVKFWFQNGYETTLSYDDVIHIKYNYAVNQYMGGNEFGQPDHRALLGTLELNDNLLSGISKAMNASYAVNGVVKYNAMMDDGKTKAALQELEQKLRNSESGFLPLDMRSEFIPLERKMKLVDEATLKFIDTKILRNWGVPLNILTGAYTKEEYEAFYQKTLEPLIVSMSQAFTKKLFTERERAFGNKIEFYPEDLIFMTTAQKMELIDLLAPTGAIYENEKRIILGLAPIPELEGRRFVSLNWIDANNAGQYQTGKDTDDHENSTEEKKQKVAPVQQEGE